MQSPLFILLKRLLLLVQGFMLCRIFFLTFNKDYFRFASFTETFLVFAQGLRFDLATIVLLNFLFIAGHVVPPKIFYRENYQVILKIFFYVVNIPALIFNIIDIGYYRFSLKRSSGDLLSMIFSGKDILITSTSMLRDYWFLIMIFAGIIIIIEFFYRRIKVNYNLRTTYKIKVRNIIIYSVAIVFFVIAARGGLQLKPVSIISAVKYTSPGLSPVILNTPFTIIKTITKNELKETNYFSINDSLKNYFHTYRYYGNGEIKRDNIVIIILESFSAEYSHLLSGYEGYTPFLDSLMKESLYFTNAQANGKKSIEGIPAIISGLPSLMTSPYISSHYAADAMPGIASHLKKYNYSSYFFHGGRNGTMGFDSYSRIAGIDNYIGMNEYGSNTGYDNNWGIYDEPFLKFTAEKLNTLEQPFLAFIFTLSSHHPYSIPQQYTNKFKKGTLPIHESIMYADYSLQMFFETIQKEPWYDETFFIITSDHTGPAEHAHYQTRLGYYRVPLLFYKPKSNLKGKLNYPVQQIDIYSSLLDYLNYDKEFYSFGTSIFNENKRYVFNYINNVYQINDEQYLLQFDGETVLSLHDYKNDSLLVNNLSGQMPGKEKTLEKTLKAIIQTYNYQMKNNKINKE